MSDAWGGSWGIPSAWGVSWGGGVVPTPTPATTGVGVIGAIVYSDKKKKRPNIAYDPRNVGIGPLYVPASLLPDTTETDLVVERIEAELEILKATEKERKRRKRKRRFDAEAKLLFNGFDLIQ